ncbi:hypothetical protein [Humibacter albus]|uniref:hypothetical protein n=1 Tax=Humibacter albus TaxID=427754 RepID=UPI0003B63632|nr:hypothetical protein [Humibacter albus]
MGEQNDRDIVTLFTKALRALGQAGRADEASRLAAQAWWGLKDTDPRAAERINGTMHYLARLMERPQVDDGVTAGDRDAASDEAAAHDETDAERAAT